MLPRVLVVRSGERSILSSDAPPGIELVERVSHRIESVAPAEDPEALEADLVLFTSQIAVERGLSGPGGAALRRLLASARVAAVGPATAAALKAAGFPPQVVGGGSAEALLRELPAPLHGMRVLFPCGADASEVLPGGLRARGASVLRRVVYVKRANPPDPALAAEIEERPFAAFCATSPAAGRWLLETAGETGAARLRSIPAVALGPSTRQFLEAAGVARVEVPGEAGFGPALRLLEALATGAARK